MPTTDVIEYERVWVEGLNRGDPSVADQSFARDCVVHITGVPQPVRGVEAWKALLQGFLTAFPDLKFTIDDYVADGDRVAMRWHATGTHRGPLGPVPPTNRPVEIDGVIFDYLEDGKVRERWEQYDQSLMMQQLGLA
ncbi:MAG: ester cyclase [Gemmatimonadaceae bacterium]|nr:ester cyclase [Gemmatimonadaceae bacterium]